MIKKATYKYNGGENIYGLHKGRHYKLSIYHMNLFERLFSRYPANWKIVAYRSCKNETCLMPFTSQEEFDSLWTQVAIKSPQETSNIPLIPAY